MFKCLIGFDDYTKLGKKYQTKEEVTYLKIHKKKF